jgi:2-iminobutanoate/2-iminopropanoate deaminase
MTKKQISTDAAPAAIGPYSQGIEAGSLIFLSGQLPVDPKTGHVPESVADQTRQALKNAESVLKAANSGLDKIVKTTVFLKDMNRFAEMNEVYATFFPGTPPARSAVEVARLPKDVLVEIEAIAVKE